MQNADLIAQALAADEHLGAALDATPQDPAHLIAHVHAARMQLVSLLRDATRGEIGRPPRILSFAAYLKGAA